MAVLSQKLRTWLDLSCILLLSPASLFQKKEYAEFEIAPFASLTLVLASLSWGTGIYMLGSSYKLTFLLYIFFLSLAQFYAVKLSMGLFRASLEDFIRKKHRDISSSPEKLELLGFFSTLPWVFFSAIAVIAKSSGFTSVLLLIVYICLSLWSFSIFVLGSQGLYGLSFSQLSLAALKALGRIAFFPLLAFSWLSLQIYACAAA